MGKDNGCVGSYSVSGYTRDDGTQVSGYTRTCGASHLSGESDVRNSSNVSSSSKTREENIKEQEAHQQKMQNRADVLYPKFSDDKKRVESENNKKVKIGLGENAYEIFARNKRDMEKDNTKNSDKYFHAKANCEAAQKDMIGSAILYSVLKEAYDIPKKMVSGRDKLNQVLADSKEDLKADFYGLGQGILYPNTNCKYLVDKYRVHGINPKY